MRHTMHHQPPRRLYGVPLDPTTERMANELRGFLVADHPGNRWRQASHADKVLRENIRQGNVRVCEHFVQAVRYSGAPSKIIALIIALATDPISDTASDFELSLEEQRAQSMTDPLQMEWSERRLDARGKFKLADCLNREIASAERMRDRVLFEAATEAGIVRVGA